MFYKLTYDMDSIDKLIKNGTNTIYAQESNLGDIEYPEIKKGFFDNTIFTQMEFDYWPIVEFYYSSKASNIESDYLLNVNRWPIIHRNVMNKLIELGIEGIKYFPIKLIDVVSNKINNNYVVMYITNFIDGFDMKKSTYFYDKQYDMYTFIPKKTFLNKEICNRYDIFRCTKKRPIIYVSEKFKSIVEENQWTGFFFYEQP